MKPTKFICQAGYTLFAAIVVVAVVALLVAIAVPNFVRCTASAPTNACINNLRIIDAAKQQWAVEKISHPMPFQPALIS